MHIGCHCSFINDLHHDEIYTAHFDKKITERDEYVHTLQKQLVECFLEKYSSDKSKKDKKDRFLT